MRSNEDERSLAQRIIAGDADAIESFVNRYRARFERIAKSKHVPYPDYQDVAQEALVDGLRQISRFQWECSLGSWLERIVRGHIINWFRKLPPSMTQINAVSPNSDKRGGVEEIEQLTLHANQETTLLVREALKAMSSKYRMLLILNLVVGLKGWEIAERLGIPKGTVGRNITEAKERFRQKLMGGENPDGI